MPTIATHKKEIEPVKILLIGDSGAGKTGSLASLAAAGYNLRVLDMDNGLPILTNYLSDPESPYVKANPKVGDKLHWITCTDPMQTSADGNIWAKSALAWKKAVSALNHWREGDVDLGKVSSWGVEDVLVIDSLTALSNAALNYHLSLNSALGMKRTQNEGRRDIGATQNMIRQLLTLLYDSSIKCNVVVTSHITMVSETGHRPDAEEDKNTNAQMIGYASSIGRALSPHIARYFNTVLIARPMGTGRAVRHKIFTSSTDVAGQVISGKNQAPLKVKPEYDLKDGLAQFFADVRK